MKIKFFDVKFGDMTIVSEDGLRSMILTPTDNKQIAARRFTAKNEASNFQWDDEKLEYTSIERAIILNQDFLEGTK